MSGTSNPQSAGPFVLGAEQTDRKGPSLSRGISGLYREAGCMEERGQYLWPNSEMTCPEVTL